MVLAASDAPGGVSWCPDCRAADPVVLQLMALHPASFVLVRAVCKRSDYAGNPNFPYRKDAQLRLPAIPTLYHRTCNHLVEGQRTKRDLVGLLLSEEGG
ncbi:hypothetical protein T492DRAFT_996538 [Pavlovales sp. CCMP2436]|nr:hypothetical protein T492DRAFT_996538 [Pavlovales sp. CCMP2436]|mmetsp:Transcript_6539/g.17000  ORF Transcript_6539/g.17000 Transcript_6539/m.17000 type:complete len:99 (-) Transcript_6539:198-494(-)